MKKRALITVPISIFLIAIIVTSFFLLNIKPDTSTISQPQKLSEYSKPAVVRIIDYAIVDWQFLDYYSDVGLEVDYILQQLNYQTIIGGSGSGAIISPNGYVVTNAHVVETSQMDDVTIATRGLEQLAAIVADYYQEDYSIAYQYLWNFLQYTTVTRVQKVVLPGGDILDGEVKSYGAPFNEGKDVAVLKIEGKNLPTLPLGDSETIENQNNIWVIGYPGAADSELLSPDSALESSMNGGQITATSKTLEQSGSPVIQIDAAATYGNSGGPVINDKGEIIGLLTFGPEVQGFNFAVPVNTVKEFVNQAGAENTSSSTDKLFKEGLELYWGGYYKDALEKFEAVARIFPTHSEIKQYISNSEKKADESKILWSNYKLLFYIIDGIAALVIIFLMIFTFVLKPKTAVAKSSPSVSTDSITDLNGDGKIDKEDVLLALKKQQDEVEKTKKKDTEE